MPPQRVLIVEDDESIREVMRMILEDAGYRVDAAAEGMAALAQLRASSDRMIVLTDLLMPVLDGEALLRIVLTEADLATRHAYLMVAAKVAPPPGVAELLDKLHASYVCKPFSLEELVAAVREAEARMAT